MPDGSSWAWIRPTPYGTAPPAFRSSHRGAMLDKRTLYRHCFALALFALAIFLCLALATYDAADPLGVPVAPLNFAHTPNPAVYPANEHIHNVCGYCGALAARAMFPCFGIAAWYVVFSLVVLDYNLFRRQEIDSPALRMVGWIASLFGLSAIFAIAFPWLSPGPVIGSGGYVGALGKAIVLAHFATAGGLTPAGCSLVAGPLLSTSHVPFEK